MPIYDTRDLIPFVNELESKILEMNEELISWSQNRIRIMNALPRIDAAQTNAISALVKADEAMSEISTATFRSVASRGKRLEDTLNKLREEMHEIASKVGGEGSGGRSLTEGMFFDELNNAIANVNPSVEDGIKLDYRLRELSKKAAAGEHISNKILVVPYKYYVESPSTTFLVPDEEGIVFVQGDVTVLSEKSEVLFHEQEMISGVIDEKGEVQLNYAPSEPVSIYFPVRMFFKDIPEEFLYLFLQQTVQKNSETMNKIVRFEELLDSFSNDLQQMKGTRWTPDYSIMKNHQEIIREGITPKGLSVEIEDGIAHVSFSYTDHPSLSHFVLEKWDEDKKQFVPYDGDNGVIYK